MRRSLFTLTAIALIVAVLAVSCVPQSSKTLNEDEHVFVWFSGLEAKAVNEDIYTVNGDGSITGANVDIMPADEMFWSYRAVKTDSGFSYGATGDSFVPVIEGAKGTGLGKPIEFSKGTWTFELKGYATNDDRTAGTNVIYASKTEAKTVTTTGNITIPVDYAYSKGYGTVSFAVTVNLSQDKLADNLASVVGTYKVTKVKVYAGTLSADITTPNSKGVYEGCLNNVPYGIASLKYEVYIADETTPRATATGNGVVLNKMQTNVTGTANVNLAKNTVQATFVIDKDDTQPKLYKIYYDFNGGTLADGVVNPECCYKGEVITPTAPTRPFCSFAGWKVRGADDSTASKTYTATSNDVTLQAVWTIDYSQCSVGSTGPAGGLIFYDAGSVQTSTYKDSSGNDVTYTWRFLEAAPADASTSSVIFGYYRTSSTGSNLTVQSSLDTSITKDDHSTYNGNAAVGQGRMNTSLLVNAMGTTAYTSSSSSTTTTTDAYAAKLCDAYSVTVGSVTYDDWFLPSIEELRYMYENLKAKSIGAWSNYYWSSSECSASYAWRCNFFDGYAGIFNRDYKYDVRAVRAF